MSWVDFFKKLISRGCVYSGLKSSVMVVLNAIGMCNTALLKTATIPAFLLTDKDTNV